jgi:hypothetical protein
MSGRIARSIVVVARLLAVTISTGIGAAVSGPATHEIYVIAHAGLRLNAEDVPDIYLGEKELATGVRLEPMDNASAQLDFLATVLKLDVKKYNAIWTKKGFRNALNPPLVRGSDAEVIQAVKSTPGGVGYVSSPPTGVSIIAKYSL